jgi:hypothetical protein
MKLNITISKYQTNISELEQSKTGNCFLNRKSVKSCVRPILEAFWILGNLHLFREPLLLKVPADLSKDDIPNPRSIYVVKTRPVLKFKYLCT